MKRKLVNLIFTVVISVMIAGAVPTSSYAMENSNIASSESSNTVIITPFMDEIGYIIWLDQNYVKWYRLWNYTKGIWLEDEWHTM